VIRILWHMLRERYYRTALEYISTFDPLNPDLLHVIVEHNKSRTALRHWYDDPAEHEEYINRMRQNSHENTE
jgi:predicted transposase YbfD/YdcC